MTDRGKAVLRFEDGEDRQALRAAVGGGLLDGPICNQATQER